MFGNYRRTNPHEPHSCPIFCFFWFFLYSLKFFGYFGHVPLVSLIFWYFQWRLGYCCPKASISCNLLWFDVALPPFSYSSDVPSIMCSYFTWLQQLSAPKTVVIRATHALSPSWRAAFLPLPLQELPHRRFARSCIPVVESKAPRVHVLHDLWIWLPVLCRMQTTRNGRLHHLPTVVDPTSVDREVPQGATRRVILELTIPMSTLIERNALSPSTK